MATATAVGCDAAHADIEESGPTTVREKGRPGRGSLIAGKYRLEMLLGEGGMACVWSAYNTELELPVAIKLLRAGLSHERLAQRLRHEARAAASLVHPGIVRVFDVAVAENGDPCIVMELLTGESLAARLRRGPLAAAQAVQLLLPIAEALAFAHAHGIVHRDVKPDNVLLSTDADLLQPKLLDFGIAKLSREATVVDKLTEKGTTLGSPNYMSPEQVRGDDVDYRSDIWSFCVLMYRSIAGIAPFHSADKSVTLDAIVHADPEPLPLRVSVDPELAQLVHWGLAKDPADRPASMRELANELSAWLIRQGIYADISGAPVAVDPATRTHAVPIARKRLSDAPGAEATERIVPVRRRAWPQWALAGVLLGVASILWIGLSGGGASARAEQSRAPRRAPAAPAALVVAQAPVEIAVSAPPYDAEPAFAAEPAARESESRAPRKPLSVQKPPPPLSRLPF